MSVVYREGPHVDYDQLTRLFEEAGWGERADREGLEARVLGSRFVITAWDGDVMVGFARAVSDGVWIAYVNDVVVRADYRGRGIGGEIMRLLTNDRKGIKFVLRADPARHAFYGRLGFALAENILVRPRT